MKELKTVRETEASKYRQENPLTKQRQFVNKYLYEHQDMFEQAMQDVFDHDKRAYAKLYIELHKNAMPKEQSVNVSMGVSKDMENLMNLGRAAGTPTLTSTPVDDAEFEDVKEKEAEKDILPPPPTE